MQPYCLIRPAVTDDAKDIASIWYEDAARAFGEAPPTRDAAEAFYLKRLKTIEPPFGIWLAVEGSSPVGWQALQPVRNNPIHGERWAESSTYVSKCAQNRGVGRMLIRFANQHAARNGIELVVGLILRTNIASRRMVESEGWLVVGTLPRLSGQDEYEYWVYTPGRDVTRT